MVQWRGVTAKVLGPLVMAVAMVSPGMVQAQTSLPAAGQTGAAGAPTSAADLGAAQQRLMELLRVSPNLANVVASDPSLLANQDYIAKSNPELAAYLVQHPEIARNPAFWLFSDLKSPQQQPYDVLEPKAGFVESGPRGGSEGFNRALDNMMPAIVLVVLMGTLVWLIRALLENRRWTKVFALQSEVHGKLIERFATSQELMGYMETDSGRRFLEAAPIVTETDSRRMPNLVSRVMATLQVGLVLALLGGGLLVLKNSVGDAGTTMLVLGIVALMPGIGLILSAAVLWALGKRLNLVESARVSTDVDLRGRE
ncbi:MAG TPA: hypothetical protein VHY48_11320 [Acidobacteriaceae bacterium]|nr:hypothetical protein [Acidobacteriaceae bacterium]